MLDLAVPQLGAVSVRLCIRDFSASDDSTVAIESIIWRLRRWEMSASQHQAQAQHYPLLLCIVAPSRPHLTFFSYDCLRLSIINKGRSCPRARPRHHPVPLLHHGVWRVSGSHRSPQHFQGRGHHSRKEPRRRGAELHHGVLWHPPRRLSRNPQHHRLCEKAAPEAHALSCLCRDCPTC